MSREESLEKIYENQDYLKALSREIWSYSELAFKEEKSAEALCRALDKFGFKVEKNVYGIKTAFKGTFGSGKPVIGVLGEFDALSGMSQVACSFEKQPDISRKNGHGCGHNLLGVGSLAAAIAIKDYLKSSKKSGTVIYFGCPGEEGGSGKTFMAREGAFENLDFSLSWHPSAANTVVRGSNLANYQILYEFEGISAHAAHCPELGRSALDAAELMNIGANFLREHIPDSSRIHYAFLDVGGTSPNVVQAHASVLYLMRGETIFAAKEIYERMNDIAKGAALMTGTKVKSTFIKACSNLLPNDYLGDVADESFAELKPPKYTNEEMEFARKMSATNENRGKDIVARGRSLNLESEAQLYKDRPIYDFIFSNSHAYPVVKSSTDIGDVSWNCPNLYINTATWVSGTAAHSWQAVSQGAYSIAEKGMLYAGSVLALVAFKLIDSPERLEKAKEEYLKRLEGRKYICPIPKGVNPGIL